MGAASSIHNMCSNPSSDTVMNPGHFTAAESTVASTDNKENTLSEKQDIMCVSSVKGRPHITVTDLVSEQDLQSLFAASRGLPIDPYFPQRKKGVCYCSLDAGGKVHFSPDSFILQSGDVNTTTGGLRREYEPMPGRLTDSPVFHQILRSFKMRCGIPDDSSIIANFHTTFPTEDLMLTSSKERRKTVTGQGVHQDGVKYAAVFCLSRSKVEGVTNYVFKEGHDGDAAACVEDEKNILVEKVLEPNQMLIWDDEEVWHYVSPPAFKSTDGERTAIVLGWPGGTSLDASVFSSDAEPRLSHDSGYNSSNDSESSPRATAMAPRAYHCSNEW